jgi:methylthioribose-1-phosphate isomerase
MADTPRPLRCEGAQLYIIDQTQLPFSERELTLDTAAQAAHAITGMQVRGAPLIGAIGAFGLASPCARPPTMAHSMRHTACWSPPGRPP